jgi:hypothetical protein
VVHPFPFHRSTNVRVEVADPPVSPQPTAMQSSALRQVTSVSTLRSAPATFRLATIRHSGVAADTAGLTIIAAAATDKAAPNTSVRYTGEQCIHAPPDYDTPLSQKGGGELQGAATAARLRRRALPFQQLHDQCLLRFGFG